MYVECGFVWAFCAYSVKAVKKHKEHSGDGGRSQFEEAIVLFPTVPDLFLLCCLYLLTRLFPWQDSQCICMADSSEFLPRPSGCSWVSRMGYLEVQNSQFARCVHWNAYWFHGTFLSDWNNSQDLEMRYFLIRTGTPLIDLFVNLFLFSTQLCTFCQWLHCKNATFLSTGGPQRLYPGGRLNKTGGVTINMNPGRVLSGPRFVLSSTSPHSSIFWFHCAHVHLADNITCEERGKICTTRPLVNVEAARPSIIQWGLQDDNDNGNDNDNDWVFFWPLCFQPRGTQYQDSHKPLTLELSRNSSNAPEFLLNQNSNECCECLSIYILHQKLSLY